MSITTSITAHYSTTKRCNTHNSTSLLLKKIVTPHYSSILNYHFRSRVQVTTEVPRQRIIPPLLPRDPEDVYEFAHEPIEEELQEQEDDDILNAEEDGVEATDDDENDENVSTTYLTSTDGTTDSPTTSEENSDTVAEASWLSRSEKEKI